MPRRKDRSGDQIQLCPALQSVRFVGVESKKKKNIQNERKKTKKQEKKSVSHYSNVEYSPLSSVCVHWVLALYACFLVRIMMTNLIHCCVINVAQLSLKISFQRFP